MFISSVFRKSRHGKRTNTRTYTHMRKGVMRSLAVWKWNKKFRQISIYQGYCTEFSHLPVKRLKLQPGVNKIFRQL